MRSITAISDWGSPSAESAVFSDCNSLFAEALCATLDGGMSARAVVTGSAELAEERPLGSDVAFCAKALAAGLVAVATARAVDAADEPLLESPNKNLAAAVKSEEVVTLKSPAACAVAAGACEDEVNSSAAFAEGVGALEDFVVLDPCAVVGVLSAELCSACGCD